MSKVQKVYYLSRIRQNNYCQVPHIRIAGEWLEEAGFKIGNKISITTNDDGSIVIKRLEEN